MLRVPERKHRAWSERTCHEKNKNFEKEKKNPFLEHPPYVLQAFIGIYLGRDFDDDVSLQFLISSGDKVGLFT